MSEATKTTRPVSDDEYAARRMKEIAAMRDPENGHIEADSLLCELLLGLGFKETVAVYKSVEKWYA